MLIPRQIKIANRKINVVESPRGYVIVGESFVSMKHNIKKHLNSLNGKEHEDEWSKEMYKLFLLAYKKEKKRMKRFE
jgi:hypothetical protein